MFKWKKDIKHSSKVELTTPEKRRRRRKILLFFLTLFLLIGVIHITGVDAANAPEIFKTLVTRVFPPRPIVKSKTVLSVSVQSAIEDIAKQQIQQQDARATLPNSPTIDGVTIANTSLLEPIIDNLQIAFTTSPTNKAKLRLEKIDRLTLELQKLLATDRSANAINKAVSLVATIGTETGKVAGDPKIQGDREILTLLIQQYNRGQIALQTVEDTLPMDGYLKIEVARVKYLLKPAQAYMENAPNLEVVNTIGTDEARKIVGNDYAELKSIEILTDLGDGLSTTTQTKLLPVQKELAANFEKRMLKLAPSVRQRKLDNYMNFSYGNPVAQVKAFDAMQKNISDRQIILGIHNLKEIALQKLSDQVSETNDDTLKSQFLDTVVKNPNDLEVIMQMQLQNKNPKLTNLINKKVVEIFGKDPEVFKTTFGSEADETSNLLDVASIINTQSALENSPEVSPEVKLVASDIKNKIVNNFKKNVNKIGFSTKQSLVYNSVPENADVGILIVNPEAVKLLNALKINIAVSAAKSLLKERVLSEAIIPEVFNEYAPSLKDIIPASKLAKVEEDIANVDNLTNQKLFEKIQQITQHIFITDNKTSIENLLPDNIEKEISLVKRDLPSKNIPEITIPEGVVLPEVAKLPDEINNAIVTLAQDKINEQNKPIDLKLNLESLASNLGVSVPVVLPDNPLYPIVELVRTVELVVTTDPIARAELLLKQDNEKTIEAAKLVENSQSIDSVDLALSTLSSVNDDFNKLKSHTAEIIKLSETEPQKVDNLVSQIIDNGLARQTVFSEIESKVHGETYVAVEEVRSEVLTKGIDTLLTLTNNDVEGLNKKLETAIENQEGGTLGDIKAVELLNEIARTQPEETQKLLQEEETKIAQNLETKIEAIPEEKRIETLLSYADNASGNPARQLEAYDVLKNDFKNPENIILIDGMKSEAITNLTDRITEITDAATSQTFVDKVIGNEPQDLKIAIEVEANVAPLSTTANTIVAEVLPIVQKIEDIKASIEENLIDTYKDKPEELAKADFFDNPTLSATPDVTDIKVVQELQTVLERSPEVAPEVVQVAKEEGIKIIDTFIQNVSNPDLIAKTLDPLPETLATLIDLNIGSVAINAQIELMKTYLTTEVTDPIVFETYINQLAGDPTIAQVVQEIGGISFQHAIETTSQTLQKEAETNLTQLVDTVTQIQQEIFSSPTVSTVEQTLPQVVQAEIQQIRHELPVSQIPSVTVEVAVPTPVTNPPPTESAPAPVSAPAPASPEPVAPAPEAPKVGL